MEGIRFGSGSLTVGEVVFREFGPELAKGWDYTKAEGSFQEILRKTLAELAGQPVGIVRVKARSAEKAVERAQKDFDRALNTLRLCIGSFPWSVIYDHELLQRRGRFASSDNSNPKCDWCRSAVVGAFGIWSSI